MFNLQKAIYESHIKLPNPKFSMYESCNVRRNKQLKYPQYCRLSLAQ